MRSRARATVLGAWLEGWRRVIRAPAIAAGVWLMTLAVALPLAFLVAQQIEAHLGASGESARLLDQWSPQWAGEFAAGATGVGHTVTPEIIGFGGTLATFSRFADADAIDPSLVGAVVTYGVLWLALSGGILDRYARGRPIRASSFFAVTGVYFFRFVRLGVVIGACYWLLFGWLHPFLFATVYDRLVRDLVTEHQVVLIRAVLYGVFFALVVLVNAVSDFAKVRAVVEDRHSMIAAIGASIRFLRRRFWRVAGLYALNALAFLIVIRLWLQTAPSASAPVWVALLAGGVFVLARIWLKLAFMAAEVVFFQGELAHAGYTAAAEPVWPDSAAVEAIRNLRA